MAVPAPSLLFSPLDSYIIDEIASSLDETPQAVSIGLKSASACLIGGLAAKTVDSTWMNQVFDLVSRAPSNLDVGHLANSVMTPSHGSLPIAALLGSQRSFLSLILGHRQYSAIDSIGRSTGLRSSVITRLMILAVPLLMITLKRIVREDRLNVTGLKGLLVSEGEAVRNLLPPGFLGLLVEVTPVPSTLAADAPPIAIGMIFQRGSRYWLWLIPLVLVPALWYLGWTRYLATTAVTLWPTPTHRTEPVTGVRRY